ncbi:hypothetical protein BBJ29_006979 [Phytophthora kernoviae]|uniref:5'-nucleotidase domain-containing protein n=1 Tax=Phytophthora kernoviae TaxID=325452 RepID=A0A3F2S2P0_9STRA|nr:hypothetical protein BBJ29_006979 [Phytophthora kernoviae]RLN68340.1 hypothetical protein BBP00_00001111 [Phytophthora kernoviae]
MALLRTSRTLLASSRCSLNSRQLSALSFVPELRAAIPKTLPTIHNLVAGYERDLQTFKPNTYIPPDVVFANNHLKLSTIDVVGFDYDYTLCHYTEELQHLIYAMARDHMVSKLKYPEGVSVLQYDPSFAIRGLTIDKQKGLLCKISSHQKLSTAAVFRGRQRLSRDEIMDLYDGSRHISVRDRDYNMEPLNDLFSVAHACLFADVVQYMIDRDIEYEPIALVEDVHQAIANVHLSGEMHKEVAQDPPKYIEPNPTLRPLLERIRLFDVVIVSARKPKFYTRKRSFRLLDIGHKQVQWHAVRALDRGEVYTQGSVYQLSKLTGWVGNRVLYIGLFSDLVEPSRANGWRTGAIIRELEDEMRVHRTPEYQRLAFQINKVEELMRNIQNELRSELNPQNHGFVDQLVDVHEELQRAMENLINANFGSVFRADAYPSQFAFFVQRYVDIYSARLENLLEYPSNHTFYPERIGMPHEQSVGMSRYE